MKTVKLGNKNVDVIGRFQLKLNTSEPKKFRMTNILSFIPAGKTMEDKKMFLSASGSVEGLFIENIVTNFNPDKSDIDAHNVAVLIEHPNVRLAGVSEEEHQKWVKSGVKESNPKWTLTNLDKLDNENYNKEVELIELRYKLYSREKPLAKEQLIWLASSFGIQYKTAITEPERYKQYLQKQIDQALQRDAQKRTDFLEALNNIKLTEMKYYIKEFEDLGFITCNSGFYKMEHRPIGASLSSVIQYFENNPSEFNMMKEQVILQHSNTVLSI